MTKWTAQELLDTLNKEVNLEELKELYKALIAYSCGETEINNEVLDQVIEYYYENDYISSMINEDVINYYNSIDK
jgi:hypothetical protein